MDNRLAALYRGVAVHATADQEHQAALELLALVMLSDSDITDSEVAVVREISTEWRDREFTFEDYLRPAIEHARRAIETERVDAFLDQIDDRISSRVLRNALVLRGTRGGRHRRRRVARGEHVARGSRGAIRLTTARSRRRPRLRCRDGVAPSRRRPTRGTPPDARPP